MTNVVQILADGRLERAKPHGKGYRFAAPTDCSVQGFLVDGRFMPRGKVAVLTAGEVLDIRHEDIEAALEGVRPIETHKPTGLQVVRALIDKATGVTDALSPESAVRVLDPGLIVGTPTETYAQWMDRTYVTHTGRGRDYERDLVLRVASAGFVLARGARPAGWATGVHWLLRADAYVPLG